MSMYIKPGFVYFVGHNFNRAPRTECVPFEPDWTSGKHVGFVYGWIAGDPSHMLTFMRPERIRVRVHITALTEDEL